MYLYILLFVLFSYFTHKQLYASAHFTGSSTTMPVVLMVFSLLNIFLIITSIIHFSIIESFVIVIVSIVFSFIFISILSRVVAKIVLKKLITDGFNPRDELFIYTYNAKCDIASTVIAEFGVLANIAIVVLYIFNFC